jgi:hypothetical protein
MKHRTEKIREDWSGDKIREDQIGIKIREDQESRRQIRGQIRDDGLIRSHRLEEAMSE